jgi:preprotein translocase subunit SecE
VPVQPVLLKGGVVKYIVNHKKESSPRRIKFMSKVGSYIQEAYDELLHKVTWPTWEELQQTTVIVMIALALVTGVVFGMDLVAENALRFIYKILGK